MPVKDSIELGGADYIPVAVSREWRDEIAHISLMEK
jgi:hypothetical protein